MAVRNTARQHALAAAEEAMAEGMWRPSCPGSGAEAAHDQFTERAARASLHIVPGERRPGTPEPGCRTVADRGSRRVEMPTEIRGTRWNTPWRGRNRPSGVERLVDDCWPANLVDRGIQWQWPPWTSVVVSPTCRPQSTPLYWVVFSAWSCTRADRGAHLPGAAPAPQDRRGLALFLLVVTLHPTGWWLIGLIVLLQFTIELLVTATTAWPWH